MKDDEIKHHRKKQAEWKATMPYEYNANDA